MHRNRFRFLIPLFFSLSLGCSSLEKQSYPAGKNFHDQLGDHSSGPEMIVLPQGQYNMGSAQQDSPRLTYELPQHRITFGYSFAVSKYEVTFEQYDKYAKANNVEKPSDKGWGSKHWGRGEMPVFNVSWYDAQNYVTWLSNQTGFEYRLITEAEWEYAVRAGTKSIYYTGDCIDTNHANYHGGYELTGCPTSNLYRGQTTRTGSFPPNPWGLHDMYGNMFEWTEDCWHENYDHAPEDGQAWTGEDGGQCDIRVLRGGSWSGRPIDIRSANRSYNKANFKSIFIGFRVVRVLD